MRTPEAPWPRLLEEGPLLVNNAGHRFVNELVEPTLAIPHQPDRVAFFVFDDRLARKFSAWPHYISTAPGVAYAFLDDYRHNRSDIYARAASVDGLARALRIPGPALSATVTAQGGVLLQAHGLHLCWAFASGRRAARQAASEGA